jgi:hypothetical protein
VGPGPDDQRPSTIVTTNRYEDAVRVTIAGRQFDLAPGASNEQQFPPASGVRDLAVAPVSRPDDVFHYGVEFVAGFRSEFDAQAMPPDVCDSAGQRHAVFVTRVSGSGTF